jgi:anti-anti-sigma factor
MPIPNWNINVVDDGTTLLVIPAGELDIHTAPELTTALDRCTDQHRVVIVDVSDLTFVDSTGLKVLVGARNRAGDRFLLAGTSPALERLLELTGTGELFRRSPS